MCQKLGWFSATKEYAILPIVIQVNNERPELFEIPKEIVMQVSIVHPE
jgi:nitric-oxide synthase